MEVSVQLPPVAGLPVNRAKRLMAVGDEEHSERTPLTPALGGRFMITEVVASTGLHGAVVTVFVTV